jgi:hypothetical protein
MEFEEFYKVLYDKCWNVNRTRFLILKCVALILWYVMGENYTETGRTMKLKEHFNITLDKQSESV